MHVWRASLFAPLQFLTYVFYLFGIKSIINNKEAVVLDIVTNEAWYLENADEKVHGLQHFEENRAAWKPFSAEDYRACDMTPPKNLAAANANTNPAQTGTGLPFAQWVKGKNDGIYQYYQAGDLTIRVSASNFKYTYESSTNPSTQPAISVTTPKKEKNNSWQPYTITEPRIPIAYNEIFMDEPFEHLETVRTSPSTNEFAFEAWLDEITVTPNAPAPSFLGLEIPLNAVQAFAKYAGEVGTTAALWVVQAFTEDLKILITGTDWNGEEGSRLWSLFWVALDTFGVGLVAKFASKLVRGVAQFGGKLAAGFLELVAKLFDKVADFAQLADEVIASAFAYFAKKASQGAAALKQAWKDTLDILFGQADEVALEGAGGLGKIGVDKVDELSKPTLLKLEDYEREILSKMSLPEQEAYLAEVKNRSKLNYPDQTPKQRKESNKIETDKMIEAAAKPILRPAEIDQKVWDKIGDELTRKKFVHALQKDKVAPVGQSGIKAVGKTEPEYDKGYTHKLKIDADVRIYGKLKDGNYVFDLLIKSGH